jgi:methylmalonyl-CoA mutase cobalamin-binding subunit
MPIAANKKILLVPLDPVHDVALKILNRKLLERNHATILLPPDLPMEEIIARAGELMPDVIMVSRTLGYGVGELLCRFIDMTEATGLRDRARLVIGGKAIKPELAAELGFDRGFGANTDLEEALAYVEEREFVPKASGVIRKKQDISSGYTYAVHNPAIASLLDEITGEIVAWSRRKSTPAIRRAHLREQMMDLEERRRGDNSDEIVAEMESLKKAYLRHCDEQIVKCQEQGTLPSRVRAFTEEELAALDAFVRESKDKFTAKSIRHSQDKPLVFVQYGTGCPIMDISHIKACEGWGADGALHFDPSWGARSEGFLDGYLSHEQDGTIITAANLKKIKEALQDWTLWAVRAHRGLNTPETVVLAGKLGADLTKISIVYGSISGGTDPARMTADGVECIRLAAKYGLPFDVVTNEELGGVPAYKAFASILIVSYLAVKLGARPILKPLFCFSPDVMISGKMDNNYVDYNAAKVMALREIMDAPIWAGEPIGFVTHSEDRVQSSLTTALHAGLSLSLGVDAITIASADEAYSRGIISVASRVDALRAVQEVFRFFGESLITPGPYAQAWKKELVAGIEGVLKQVARRGSFVQSLYEGLLGSPEDGVHPGRAGRGTVIEDA